MPIRVLGTARLLFLSMWLASCSTIMASVCFTAAEAEQPGADFLRHLHNWQACFTKENVTAQNAAPIIAACDRALAFSNLLPKERERLARRRLMLSELLHRAVETKSDGNPEAGASRIDERSHKP